ncbi:hypothetical protein ACOSQ2_025290 [Xanthoceras sorbifolium]
MYSVEAVAHSLKLPSIILRTSSPKSMGMVPGLHPLRFKDLPVYDFKNEDTLLQLTATVRNTGTSSAVVWNSMDCLEQSSLAQLQQQCQVPNFSIGLMQKMALTSSSKELVEIAWGLANSKQRILWVLRPGSVHRSNSAALLYDDFKETVGARGCIVTLRSLDILLFFQCGIHIPFLLFCFLYFAKFQQNSTLESISEGVPMICRPMLGDQKVNSKHISQGKR